ncbi:MAG: insulinase family protein [Pseudarcicella sp.]|nr:insulinase family protein [Pseudarcicella sp.]MBP6409570.1 insulinase family protein [Pseudarcicella sp.]
MINYSSFVLDNGLKVFVHQDFSTQIAALNILYNVGSRDEDPEMTGFAHLFEHLMFGGSINIPSYDTPLQLVGGQNNAFTSPDITNYYITLPVANLETAFWLESDRMLSLNFNQNSLDIQKKVVIEEFNQRYLNQPYGDAWLHLRPLAYTTHPYKWATIGKNIEHIENAHLDDVKAFFYKHYLPNNATMVVSGPVDIDLVKALSKKWFEPIPAGNVVTRNLPKEPKQIEARSKFVEADVPHYAIYKVYHSMGRYDSGFASVDLLSDILGRGKSSLLYEKLVKKNAVFNSITASLSPSLDPGLFVIQGNLRPDVGIEEGNMAIENTISDFLNSDIDTNLLDKVKNQALSSLAFSEVELLNRTINLAQAVNAGNADFVNEEQANIMNVIVEDISLSAVETFDVNNCSTLFYKSINF